MAIDFSGKPAPTRRPSPTPQPRSPQASRPRPIRSAFEDPRLHAFVKEYGDRQDENDVKATEASNRWLRRKAYLTAYLERNAHAYSELQRRQKVSDDWELRDAMDAWSWHTREAARCHAAIETKLRRADLYDRLHGIRR